jgi:hypothetical protein
VQSSLVTAVRRPGSHRTESVTGAQSQRLSPAVADAVRTALTDVASPAAGGTARTLAGRTAASSTSRPAPMSWSSPTRRRLLGCSPDRLRGSSGSSRPPTGVVRRGGGDTRRDRGSARGAGRRPLGHRRRCGGTRRTAQARASSVSDRGWSGRCRVVLNAEKRGHTTEVPGAGRGCGGIAALLIQSSATSRPYVLWRCRSWQHRTRCQGAEIRRVGCASENPNVPIALVGKHSQICEAVAHELRSRSSRARVETPQAPVPIVVELRTPWRQRPRTWSSTRWRTDRRTSALTGHRSTGAR